MHLWIYTVKNKYVYNYNLDEVQFSDCDQIPRMGHIPEQLSFLNLDNDMINFC